jgi:hypothetical protein
MAIRSFDNDTPHIHKAGLKLLHGMKIKDYNWRRQSLMNKEITYDELLTLWDELTILPDHFSLGMLNYTDGTHALYRAKGYRSYDY